MEYKSPETVCGWVRNIGRDGQEAHLTTLKELADADLDMFCTVFVGTAGTKAADGFMVTPRGYEEKK
jgi:precorrin-3B C17-methyltransferase